MPSLPKHSRLKSQTSTLKVYSKWSNLLTEGCDFPNYSTVQICKLASQGKRLHFHMKTDSLSVKHFSGVTAVFIRKPGSKILCNTNIVQIWILHCNIYDGRETLLWDLTRVTRNKRSAFWLLRSKLHSSSTYNLKVSWGKGETCSAVYNRKYFTAL